MAPRKRLELQAYFAGDPDIGFIATPGAGANVEMWILGSSTFGAQLAAALGLPFGFASHFAPGVLDQAIAIYREHFRPSQHLAKPRVMAAFNIFAADDQEEAEFLATSMQQAFVSLRTGQPGKLKPPVRNYIDTLPPQLRAMLDDVLAVTSVGTPDRVAADLRAFLRRTQADEIIVTSQIFDHAARKRSIAIAAEAFATLDDAVSA